MMSSSLSYNRQFETLLRDGITAVKGGSRRLAWSLLNQATQINPFDARPWIWLTETTDSDAEKLEYLEHAVAADPRNMAARRGLAVFTGNIEKDEMLEEGEQVQSNNYTDPLDAQSKKYFLCPQCGARLDFDIDAAGLMCHHCGFVKEVKDVAAADSGEQVLDFVLPTRMGHRWSEAQHRMICEQCGADGLWPPGLSAVRCPYCKSNQLIESSETKDLLDPDGIVLMNVSEDAAVQNVSQWLRKGWFSPDDLIKSAGKSLVRPAYFPFWTFDGTLDLNWSCEVNERTGDKPRWVPKSGVVFELFDDVLIPGLQRITKGDMRRLGLFNLKAVVDFKDDFLAGWPTLFYDYPLSKASLDARELVVRKARRELHARVEHGQQKRRVNSAGVHWSDMTYKFILLPLWFGIYTYKGKPYKIMINGQTGRVGGEKPRDMVKATGIIVAGFFSIITVLLVIAYLALSNGWLSLP